MTLVKNHKEHMIDGVRYFVEKYADKPGFVWFWRYGKYGDYDYGANATVIKNRLLTRPNLKRLFAG